MEKIVYLEKKINNGLYTCEGEKGLRFKNAIEIKRFKLSNILTQADLFNFLKAILDFNR